MCKLKQTWIKLVIICIEICNHERNIYFFKITFVNKLILDRKQPNNQWFYKYRPGLHLTPLSFELQELSSYYLAPNRGMMIMMYYFVAWAFSFFAIQSYNIAQRCIFITHLVWWETIKHVMVQQLFMPAFDILVLESRHFKTSKAKVK